MGFFAAMLSSPGEDRCSLDGVRQPISAGCDSAPSCGRPGRGFACGRPRPSSLTIRLLQGVDFNLHLGDATELQIEVMSVLVNGLFERSDACFGGPRRSSLFRQRATRKRSFCHGGASYCCACRFSKHSAQIETEPLKVALRFGRPEGLRYGSGRPKAIRQA